MLEFSHLRRKFLKVCGFWYKVQHGWYVFMPQEEWFSGAAGSCRLPLGRHRLQQSLQMQGCTHMVCNAWSNQRLLKSVISFSICSAILCALQGRSLGSMFLLPTGSPHPIHFIGWYKTPANARTHQKCVSTLSIERHIDAHFENDKRIKSVLCRKKCQAAA